MKLLLSVTLLAVLNGAFCYYPDQTTYIRLMKQRMQKQQLSEQFQAMCPGKATEVEEALEKIESCTDEIDENSETMCSAIKNHFMRCSEPMITVIDSCLPAESQGVPRLVFNAVNKGIEHLCKSDGEHIFELANTCIFKTNFRTRMCERRIRAKLQQYKNKPPTKTQLCDLLTSLKPCLLNHLEDSCGNRITRDSFMGVYDAVASSCAHGTDSQDKQLEFNTLNEVEVF